MTDTSRHIHGAFSLDTSKLVSQLKFTMHIEVSSARLRNRSGSVVPAYESAIAIGANLIYLTAILI